MKAYLTEDYDSLIPPFEKKSEEVYAKIALERTRRSSIVSVESSQQAQQAEREKE